MIDNAHFNDEDKLGKGQEMVDKLDELLGIFRDQVPDLQRTEPTVMISSATLMNI